MVKKTGKVGRPPKEEDKKNSSALTTTTDKNNKIITDQNRFYTKDATAPYYLGRKNNSVDKQFIYPNTAVDPLLLQWYGARYHKSNRVTYGVARDLFKDWFFIGDSEGQIIPELDRRAQSFAEKTNLHANLVTAWFHERWGGWSILVDWERFAQAEPEPGMYNQKFEPPYKFESFHINEIENIIYDENKGVPKIYKVRKKIGGTKGTNTSDKTIPIPAEFVYHIVTRPHFDKFEGQSVLDPIYYTLAQSVSIDFGLGRAFIRYGTGFPLFTYDNLSDEDKTQVDKIIDQFDSLNGMKLPEGVKFEFAGNSGKAMDPQPYVKIINQNISASTNVPVNQLEGQEVGSLVAAQVNQEEYQQFLSGLKETANDTLRDIYIMNEELPDDAEAGRDWFIIWNDSDLTKKEELENRGLELDNEGKELDNEKKKLELEQMRKKPNEEPQDPEDPTDPSLDPPEEPDEPDNPEEEEPIDEPEPEDEEL